MSKSILVIDTPSKCKDCVLCAVTEDEYMSYCCGNGNDIEKNIKNGSKSDQCPLWDFPERKEEKQYLTRKDDRNNTETYGETTDMVAVGWNMCIDEILRGGANQSE